MEPTVEEVLVAELEAYDPFDITPYAAQEVRYAFNEIQEEDLPIYLHNLADYLEEESGNATLLSIRLQHDYHENGTDLRIESIFSVSDDQYTNAMWKMHCLVRGC